MHVSALGREATRCSLIVRCCSLVNPAAFDPAKGSPPACTTSRAVVSEATILSSMNHFNIVRLIGVSLQPERLAIVLEFAERGSLDAVLARTTMTLGSGLLTILLQTANALLYLHSKSFVHLDVKSANIVLRDDFSAVLADFGTAKRVDDDCKVKTGSHFYVAPEITRGEGHVPESDIFSFGILMLEVGTFYLHRGYLEHRYLHGKGSDLPIQVAFGGRDVREGFEMSRKMAQEGWRPSISPALGYHWPNYVMLIEECWAQDPKDRPSMENLVAKLAACEGDPRGRGQDRLLGAHQSLEDARQFHEYLRLCKLHDSNKLETIIPEYSLLDGRLQGSAKRSAEKLICISHSGTFNTSPEAWALAYESSTDYDQYSGVNIVENVRSDREGSQSPA